MTRTRHASDATLLRALDGELDTAEREALTAHLAVCAPCRACAEALRVDAALVRARVATAGAGHVPPFTWADVVRRAGTTGPTVVSHPEPRTRRVAPTPSSARGRPVAPHWWRAGRRRVDWRIAAGVLLAAGVAAAAPAALRWARVGDGSGRDAGPGSPSPRAPRPRAEGAGTAAHVAFALPGDTLHVAFDAPQPAGVLELVASPATGAAVEVEVRGAPGAARLLVLPDGVRVRNDPTSVADYRIVVPVHVRVVRVAVGARALPPVARARLATTSVHVPLTP